MPGVPVAVTVGSFTPSVVLDVARSTGRLDDVGLAVTELPVTSSPGQFRDLVDGRLDIALTSPDNVLAYRFSPGNPLGERFDARIVSAVDRGMGLGLYARPGLTAEDLRGARVGVDVPTSGFALALYALADSLGVGRDDYELVTLGSTPRRLEALLAGDCDATMLNAGNELVAEREGCPRLASVAGLVGPRYLGTVVAVTGETRLAEARALGAALTSTAAELAAGGLTDVAREAAARRLHLDDELAARYVERLRSNDDGLVADGRVDPEALGTLVRLRRHYLPEEADGSDVLARALEDDAGLVDRPVTP